MITPQNPTSDFIRPDLHASIGINSRQGSDDFDGLLLYLSHTLWQY